MITADDLQSVEIFAQLDGSHRERFATKAADLRLFPQEWLLHEGEPSHFYVLLEGSVEMSKDLNGRLQRLHRRGPSSYFGEMPILLGTVSAVSIQAVQACRLARFEKQHLQELLRECPSFEKAISKTLMDRVVMACNYAKATPSSRVALRGHPGDALCQSMQSFLFANHVPYERYFFDEFAVTSAASSQPEIMIDGVMLPQPISLRMLAEALGLQTGPKQECYDLLVIGAGPAGMAAAVYGSSEGLATLVVEKATVGGQAGTSSRIENYLGFPGGISGTDLSGKALKQAQHFGAEIIVTRQVINIHKEHTLFWVTLDGGEKVSSKSVLLASGVEWRLLRTAGIDRLLGRGVFYGASRTEASTLRGKRAYLVGGGNSAGQAAKFLSDYAAEVHILVRSAGLAASMSQYLIDQLAAKKNVWVHTQTKVQSLSGDSWLEGLTVCTREERQNLQYEHHAADALFVMIGATARTAWLPSSVERDTHGYIRTGQQIERWNLQRQPFALESSLPGLFCAGDVRHNSVKRVASGVGEGSVAVSFVHQYIGSLA